MASITCMLVLAFFHHDVSCLTLPVVRDGENHNRSLDTEPPEGQRCWGRHQFGRKFFPQLDDFWEFCFQNLESKDVAPQNNPVEKGRVTVIKTMNACLVLCVVTITVNSLVSTTTRRMTAVYLVSKMNFGTEFLSHHV